ncbi:MAG: MFS transporter [Cyanobacteria bacterium J149]|nr:MAG: MFS transporter [Cyanobacteria bacterium J149]
MILIFFIIAIMSLRTVTGFEQNKRTIFDSLTSIRNDPNFILAGVFLVFYSLSLFLQDSVLEPFAIEEMGFERGDIGTLTLLSNILSLIFIPAGVLLERRSSRLKVMYIGVSTMIMGLALLILLSVFPSLQTLYTGVAFFGIGAGITSAPGFAYLLDVGAKSAENTGLVISLFGLVITLTRSLSNFIPSLILYLSSNYFLVFTVEFLMAIALLYPLSLLDQKLATNC